MGIFESIFKRPRANVAAKGYFKMLNGYTPVFTNANESVYEMELTRAAIHTFATFCSKLKPELQGAAHKSIESTLQWQPNPFMSTSKFLARVATILMVNNTAFIVPVEDQFGTLTGYYPILPSRCEVVDVEGKPFLRYTFSSGQKAAIEFERVGIMTRMQYSNDFFGETNACMYPTMQLMHVQNEGIVTGIKNGAYIRFIARLVNTFAPDTIRKERKRFTDENLAADNGSGVMIFDSKYAEVKTVDSKPYIVNAAAMAQIRENVFTYFSTNAGILQNKFTEDEWNAYYEGAIEPFAIQLSEVLTLMTYTPREIAHRNAIMFTTNRLQYASNTTKLALTQLFDRALMTRNQMMDVWNQPRVEGGDTYYIRREYVEVSKLDGEGAPVVTPAANKDQNKEGEQNADESNGTGVSGNAVAADGGSGAKAD